MTQLDMGALDTLKETIGGDEAFFAELVESFLDDAPHLLEDLRAAIDTSDAGGARLAAHSLKSLGRDFGATTLAEQCKQLEQMGKAGDVSGAEALLIDAEAEFEAVRVALLDLIHR
jgi:HPt (histidine-containing phosphotransfer) domain-containing protein